MTWAITGAPCPTCGAGVMRRQGPGRVGRPRVYCCEACRPNTADPENLRRYQRDYYLRITKPKRQKARRARRRRAA